jgi:putative transposase
MSAHQSEFRIRMMAHFRKVPASGYDAWHSRRVSLRAVADAAPTRRIRTAHLASRGTYGAPRIHAELKVDGIAIGKKRVARIRRAASLAGASHRPLKRLWMPE